MKNLKLLFVFTFLFPWFVAAEQFEIKPFAIQIVDSVSGRGIPLVELEMENGLKFLSDNDGYISILAPDLVNRNVRLKISGNGYSTGQKDFWGEEAKIFQILPGSFQKVDLQRQQPAERLYRITGAGRFNHTILAGIKPSFVSKDNIPGQVIGQDSLISVPWKGRIWNFYGDTLGLTGFNFSASCATIPLPESNQYDPEVGIPLEYLTDQSGFARKMIETGKKGFTWIEYVVPVEIGSGAKQTLLARYVQHSSLEKVEEAGFALYSETQGNFHIVKRISPANPHKCTHPVPVMFNGQKKILLFPWEMTSPELREIMKEKQHLVYSPLVEVSTKNKTDDSMFKWQGKKFKVARDLSGSPIYKWRLGAVPSSPDIESELIKLGLMRLEESVFAPIELSSGERISNFNGSITFNHFKKRWTAINQGNHPGEIVYAEADTPTGPWAFARKVAWFKNYNLYNPIQHPLFAKKNGCTIFFEGTYTNYFSASPGKNPEADYNQVMFRLDLSQDELIMPIPVYRIRDKQNKLRLVDGETLTKEGLWKNVEEIEFFAFSTVEQQPDLVTVYGENGEELPFKILVENPTTEWGKGWLKSELKPYLRVYGVSAGEKQKSVLCNYEKKEELCTVNGRVLKIEGIASTFSPEISNLSWIDIESCGH